MNSTHPRQMLDALERRRRFLPQLLRRLWNAQHPLEEVVDVCDDLLADIDSVISVATAGIAAGLPYEAEAEHAVQLKRSVYFELLGFCRPRSPSLEAVLHRSSLRDLTDSADRIRVARHRAAARAQHASPGCHP